jgi:hypothetical protein
MMFQFTRFCCVLLEREGSSVANGTKTTKMAFRLLLRSVRPIAAAAFATSATVAVTAEPAPQPLIKKQKIAIVGATGCTFIKPKSF